MSIRQSPWWFCTGWWSPWCVADAALHWFHRTFHEDRCGWVCEKHDRALIRHMAEQERAEFEAGWEKAEPVEVEGAPRVVLTSTWPTYANTSATSTTATVTWRSDGTSDWRWS